MPDFEVQSATNQGMSMGYGFSELVAYSVIVSLVAAVFIGLYLNCNKTKNEIVNGEEHKMVVNKLDILTFDNSDFCKRKEIMNVTAGEISPLVFWK